ncbi:MAG: hypothetical protein AAF293_01485 [Pseudomonadota bacterium]
MDRDDLLLAYLQKRLEPNARVSFETEMAADPVLAAEVEVMRATRGAMAEEVPEQTAQEGWQRLQSTLEREGQAPANLNRSPAFALLKAAAVAVFAVAVWQFAVVPQIGPAPEDGYRTVSSEVNLPSLQVTFRGDATIGDVAAILSAHEGTIVDGPGTLGVFRISFPSEARRSAALSDLEDRSGLIESIFQD